MVIALPLKKYGGNLPEHLYSPNVHDNEDNNTKQQQTQRVLFDFDEIKLWMQSFFWLRFRCRSPTVNIVHQ